MSNYKHFIVTLFNLRRVWLTDKNNNKTNTPEWLDERFNLFEKYCFPSVNNQLNKEFIWLCLFDEDTPPKYIELIESYRSNCPQMVPCFFRNEDMSDWIGRLKGIIREHTSKEDLYIITTNLDNDDMIHENMIGKIQKEFNKRQETGVYSMIYGYQYFLSDNLLLKMRYPHSHFLSLAEKNTSDFTTIKGNSHGKMRKLFNTIDIKDEPFWIECVHDTNVNNDLRITSRIKYYPVFRSISLDKFGLDYTLPESNNIKKMFFTFPCLFAKTVFHKIRKKTRRD